MANLLIKIKIHEKIEPFVQRIKEASMFDGSCLEGLLPTLESMWNISYTRSGDMNKPQAKIFSEKIAEWLVRLHTLYLGATRSISSGGRLPLGWNLISVNEITQTQKKILSVKEEYERVKEVIVTELGPCFSDSDQEKAQTTVDAFLDTKWLDIKMTPVPPTIDPYDYVYSSRPGGPIKVPKNKDTQWLEDLDED